MAPPKRKLGKRSLKKDSRITPTTREISTQTEKSPIEAVLKELIQPVVVLERIEEEQQLVVPDSSSPQTGTSKRTSTKVMKVPENYSGFARPITNNTNVNSTLDILTRQAINRQEGDSRNTEKPRSKSVKIIKPGPLCSKKKRLEEEEDLSIPVMLSQVNNSPAARNLATIFERSAENITPNNSNLNIDGISPMIQEIATQTISSDVCTPLNEEISRDFNFENLVSSESPTLLPQNIRLQFEGVTTVISARSENAGNGDNHQRNEESEDEEYENRNNSGQKAKFIKITASTVHIHNHFYKA